MERSNEAHSWVDPWGCTCGWEADVGQSVHRAFDKHLLDLSSSPASTEAVRDV